MRRVLLRWAAVITLVAMLGGHVTELFDHWDHTLRTGKDADYTTVFVAACVAFVFAVATRAAAKLLARSSRLSAFGSRARGRRPEDRTQSPNAEAMIPGPSPPALVPLRI